MLKNYFKIAFRNLRNSKLYSAINISGMAVSLAACILLLLWVKDELSFDHFHKNIDNIYKIAANMGQDGKETIWDNTPARWVILPKRSCRRLRLPAVYAVNGMFLTLSITTKSLMKPATAW